MNTIEKIYGCCGDNDGWTDVDSRSSDNNCCNSDTSCCCNSDPCCGRSNPVEDCFDTIRDELCDMKTEIAETKAALAFLAQTICNNNCGCISEQEKQLLLLIESNLNDLNCQIKDSRANLDCLEDLITC